MPSENIILFDARTRFTVQEKRNIFIYVVGITLYKFGIEAFSGATHEKVERRGTMYRGKKTVRRGGGNSQVRGQNTTKTRPMTRQQSVLLCEKDQTKENDEKFALVE
ncbi:unnamed protein product [Rotaria sp. Silwood2]|nr:unnamed protein product [Rotaria sp. Silwood2]